MSSLKLLAPVSGQSPWRRDQVVSSPSAVLTLSAFRATHGLLLAGGPLGVLLGDQTFDPLGQLAVPVLPNVRTDPV
jgi:hypothetical protein